MDLEDCLLIIIFSILFYFLLLVIQDAMKEPIIIGGATSVKPPKFDIRPEARPDNIETKKEDPVKLCKKITKRYDEYDDESLLRELDPKMIKSFDNIVIDGTNFIYGYRECVNNITNKQMDAKEQLALIKKSVALLTKHFPAKNLYFVFKDPENEKQTEDLLKTLSVSTIKQAHKKFFNELAKEHPKARFVIAYGDARYRDDYAAIWLSDTLPDETILLSRDRFRDVSEMASASLKFKTYGKRASAIDKIINKPFNYVTKGAVKAALVGYSFSKKTKSGFYYKVVNKKSDASDTVYIIKI